MIKIIYNRALLRIFATHVEFWKRCSVGNSNDENGVDKVSQTLVEDEPVARLLIEFFHFQHNYHDNKVIREPQRANCNEDPLHNTLDNGVRVERK